MSSEAMLSRPPTLAGRGLCHSVLKAITLNVACLKYCSSPTPGLTLPLRLWEALTQAHSLYTTEHNSALAGFSPSRPSPATAPDTLLMRCAVCFSFH